MMPKFEMIWERIKANENELFFQKKGGNFTYQISENELIPDRTDFLLHKSNFEKAYHLVPFKGPGVINRLVMGPSFVWAILHDKRIRGDDW